MNTVQVTDTNHKLFGKVFQLLKQGEEYVIVLIKDGDIEFEKLFHKNQVAVVTTPVVPVAAPVEPAA